MDHRAWFLVIAPSLAACSYKSPPPSDPPPLRASAAPVASAPEPFAFVELFTSEGCSSCPPADDVLHRVAAEHGVYALSFHVDYWNSLGWPDPFSDARYTARQRLYARAFGTSSVFTPQIVVNGTSSFTGSDEPHVRAAIVDALHADAGMSLALDVTRGDAGTLNVRVDARPAPGEPSDVEIVLAERTRVSHVPRGENAGRTLRHDHVVRALLHVPLDADGHGKGVLALAPGDLGASDVVAWAHPRASMRVVAAARIGL